MTIRLYCNVGWMTAYRGITETDSIVGGGTHVKRFEHGGEICNFAPHNGYVYGYVQPPKGRRKKRGPRDIKLERLRAKATDGRIDGVTIIWTASRPGFGRVVIGWYNNATLYRAYQEFRTVPKLHFENSLDGYYIRAAAHDAVLLPVDSRVVKVPSKRKDTFGQSNIWYADTDKAKINAKKIFTNLKRAVRESANNKVTSKKRRRALIDQARKRLVEDAAIDHVWQHYDRMGYELETVEKENLGWDLTATCRDVTLRIEVKGLSAAQGLVDLTPNEYKAFKSELPDYRLCIVTSALGARRLRAFSYHKPSKKWLDEISRTLNLEIKQRESASLSMA